MKKDIIVSWDKLIFDGEERLLPNTNTLYSQIYDVPEVGDSWSLLFEFESSPILQGYTSKGTVKFISQNAPNDVLKDGFKFDFYDGPNVVGKCEVITPHSLIPISEVLTRIELIEDEKKDFQAYINLMIQNNFESIKFDSNDLEKLFKYVNTYPYLFKLLAVQDKAVSLDYLDEYFFKTPLENKAVYKSNLSFFLFQLRVTLGENEYQHFIEKIPHEVKTHAFISNALKEID